MSKHSRRAMSKTGRKSSMGRVSIRDVKWTVSEQHDETKRFIDCLFGDNDPLVIGRTKRRISFKRRQDRRRRENRTHARQQLLLDAQDYMDIHE